MSPDDPDTQRMHNHVNSSVGMVVLLLYIRLLYDLILKTDFLPLDTANDDLGSIFGNDFVVMKHFEF
jgi:hypothetical protein